MSIQYHTVDKPHRKDLLYDLKALLDAAVAAKKNSYSPYSQFRVGAALVTVNGEIFTGCNVESCSYGLTNCAERVTLQNAVSSGVIGRAEDRSAIFHAIAITSDLDTIIKPCGACRQVMAEFGQYDVLLTRVDGSYVLSTVRDLLPAAFVPQELIDAHENAPEEEIFRPTSPRGPMVAPKHIGANGTLADLESETEKHK